MGQMRVTAADDPCMAGKRTGQRAEAVVEYQYPGGRRQVQVVQVREQGLVRRVERLQRRVGLLGLSGQIEAGEGRFDSRHRNWRCLSAADWSINGAEARAVIVESARLCLQ